MSQSLEEDETTTSEISLILGKEAEKETSDEAAGPVNMRLGRSGSPVPSVQTMQTDHSKEESPDFSKEMEPMGPRDHTSLVETHLHPQCRKRSGAPSRSGDTVCDVCSEERARAVKFCQTCSAYFCETHIRGHYTAEELQRHKLDDITDSCQQEEAKQLSASMETEQGKAKQQVGNSQYLHQNGRRQEGMCIPVGIFQKESWVECLRIWCVVGCVLAILLLFIILTPQGGSRAARMVQWVALPLHSKEVLGSNPRRPGPRCAEFTLHYINGLKRLGKSGSPAPSVQTMHTDRSKEEPPYFSKEAEPMGSRDQTSLVETHLHPQCRKRSGAPSRSGDTVCDVCSEGRARAVKFCQTCSAYYCETHIREHYTAEELQRHKLDDITESCQQEETKQLSASMETEQGKAKQQVGNSQYLHQNGWRQEGMYIPAGVFQKECLRISSFGCVLAILLLFIILTPQESGRRPAPHDLRIVLVGKTGAGKSATGNTILGREVFKEVFSPKSVTLKCEEHSGEVAGRHVTVIDTPGIFHTSRSFDQITREMVESKSHFILLVIRLGRFTEEERASLKWIQENLGEEALQYTMVLFTGGDELRSPVEDFLSEGSGLQELIHSCGSGYYVFNNRDRKNRTQVAALLEKIDTVLFNMTGYHHATTRIQQVQRMIQTEEERKREEIEREIREEEERKREESEREIRAEEERKREEMNNFGVGTGIVIVAVALVAFGLIQRTKAKEKRKREESEREIRAEEKRKRDESEREIRAEEERIRELNVIIIRAEDESKREEIERKIRAEEEGKWEEIERKIRALEERNIEEMKEIHPSIHYLNPFILNRVAGGLEPIPAYIGRKAGIHPRQVASPSQGMKEMRNGKWPVII